ncbi:Hypothetical predicted protein [Octopus vulgaris]|uniref:Uncharacterized protein n=1 Tax=Octopus vulgaris TaxID=6645 RepID=A0AA36BTY8_OCTVU|nr:Hypothetical predicted protein [Octopus vulgaris]
MKNEELNEWEEGERGGEGEGEGGWNQDDGGTPVIRDGHQDCGNGCEGGAAGDAGGGDEERVGFDGFSLSMQSYGDYTVIIAQVSFSPYLN